MASSTLTEITTGLSRLHEKLGSPGVCPIVGFQGNWNGHECSIVFIEHDGVFESEWQVIHESHGRAETMWLSGDSLSRPLLDPTTGDLVVRAFSEAAETPALVGIWRVKAARGRSLVQRLRDALAYQSGHKPKMRRNSVATAGVKNLWCSLTAKTLKVSFEWGRAA